MLHLSDVHMTPRQHRKQEWVRGLAALEPDLVVDTGDNLAHLQAVPSVLDAYGALLDVPGVFVFGSNDYFAPRLKNPARYLLPDDGDRSTGNAKLPWRELRAAFEERGWVDLSNRRAGLEVAGTTVALAGVDDPHLGYDDLATVAGPADATADVRLAVTHAPYLRVLDQFAADGYDAVIAGHTHGGQLCLPGGRALVTNCDLEPARARGLHRHPASSVPGGPRFDVAARLGGPRDLAVRPRPVLLQAGGDADRAHARAARLTRGPGFEGVAARIESSVALGLWRSLVARVVRDDEAAGSNPVSPT